MTDEVFSRYKFGISSSRFLVKIAVGYIQESAWPCLAKQFLYFLALKWQISTRGRFLNFWVLTRGFLLYRTFDTSELRDFLDVSFSSRLRKSISRLLLALHFIFARGKRDYFRTVIITIRRTREYYTHVHTHMGGMTVLAVSGYIVKKRGYQVCPLRLLLWPDVLMFHCCKNIDRSKTLTSQESAMK